MAEYEYHPVFGLQSRLNAERHTTMEPHEADIMDDLAGAIDNTPKFVAGLALGALLVLVSLKALGFRFVFGSNISVGK